MRASSSEDTIRSPPLGIVLPSTSVPPVQAVMYDAVEDDRVPISCKSPRATVSVPVVDTAELAEISMWPCTRDNAAVGPNVGAKLTGTDVTGVPVGTAVGTAVGAQVLPGTVGLRDVGATVGANVIGVPVGTLDTGVPDVGVAVGEVVVGVADGAALVGVRLVGLEVVGVDVGVRVVGTPVVPGTVGLALVGVDVGELVPEQAGK